MVSINRTENVRIKYISIVIDLYTNYYQNNSFYISNSDGGNIKTKFF